MHAPALLNRSTCEYYLVATAAAAAPAPGHAREAYVHHCMFMLPAYKGDIDLGALDSCAWNWGTRLNDTTRPLVVFPELVTVALSWSGLEEQVQCRVVLRA